MVPRMQPKPDIWSEYVRKCRLAASDHADAQMKLTEDLMQRLGSLQRPLSLCEGSSHSDSKPPIALTHVHGETTFGKTTEHIMHMLDGEYSYSMPIEAGIVPRCVDETPQPSLTLGLQSSRLMRGCSDVSGLMPTFMERTNLHLKEQGSQFSRSLKTALGEEPFFTRFLGLSEDEEEGAGVVYRIVQSRCFQVASASVIAVHTFFIIANTNSSMREAYRQTASNLPSENIDWLDLAFMIFYAIELVLRLWAFKLRFFINRDALWNSLDFFLVAVSLVGLVKSGSDQSANVLAMRSARILKLARLLRVVRAMRFFKQLQLFVDIILGCCESLFWAVVMVILLLLLFSIFFVQMMDNWVRSNWSLDATEEVLHTGAGVEELFGSVQAAMLTLSKAVSGGMDWEAAYDVAAKTGYVNGMAFLSMVAFFIVAVWNIVASVFIENTIQAATFDRDQQVVQEHQAAIRDAKELMDLCRQADLDKSGTFSTEEFQAFISSDKIQEFFLSRGLDIKNAEHFYDMLNAASEGDELELEYFVGSCLRVKGSATSIDLQMLSYEHKVSAVRMKTFSKFVHEALEELCVKIDRLHCQMPLGCKPEECCTL
eukprot:TRINITY_DN36313_c0_g1_i1.p1 TRINITY_DN36313_c0_g1~~TRINITY_DN36313_c0_g1_i1.p1  ORF type:complete len:598 (+),score=80.17 TRINITY_DN36313_c0_g1_i1:163-1956(+)